MAIGSGEFGSNGIIQFFSADLDRFKVDRTVEEADPSDYDALVLPGGVGTPTRCA